MSEQLTVQATEFVRNFSKYREDARDVGIIRVEYHGRVAGAYLSARELDHFEQLKLRERRHLSVAELPEETIAALEESLTRYGE